MSGWSARDKIHLIGQSQRQDPSDRPEPETGSIGSARARDRIHRISQRQDPSDQPDKIHLIRPASFSAQHSTRGRRLPEGIRLLLDYYCGIIFLHLRSSSASLLHTVKHSWAIRLHTWARLRDGRLVPKPLLSISNRGLSGLCLSFDPTVRMSH
ncbi:hypothetical protein E6O75_ATG10364 [Venturia nashicola]|uniref:Uncharacterized protein n=1 Tax=Venturia nashicola TaxID=86259 RepID=A0A4Z1P0U3_9PEZI|nr:hypothetical protein E6O75_ATG10364 [Venturia nashicola]